MHPVLQDEDFIPVPRIARFPIELDPPPGFKAEDLKTWPRVDGKLEFYDGRLWYMPPSGGEQGHVAIDAGSVFREWARRTPGYVVSGNEAGMLLKREVRAADVGVWTREDYGSFDMRLRRKPPVVAVEVLGRDDSESYVRKKTRWYLDRRVRVVCFVRPKERDVVVVNTRERKRFSVREKLTIPELPGFEVLVSRFFEQLD
jgi:Uma2 family endonuclease